MKKQIIQITSLPKTTRVTIQKGHGKQKRLQFRRIDEAVEFVLPRGHRDTELYLNGYSCVLAGWVDGAAH